ncbi:uncharacterized protein LOC117299789 isoform X2 [Asterias rubens]|uniref:uncharacterized protein LOC117299789 isoform X2 n=1 Tax=Asterias rubens TaxID=7604 RepID=UPI0014551EC9|nr:uncharacterized protein LOC117299789 isoform X2 [Asterias rubens]
MDYSYNGANDQGGGLRVNPAYLEQGEANTGQRRATHSIGKSAQNLRRQYLSEKDRRHTLSSQAPATSFGQRPLTTEQKRELFMEYLKEKYPDHSSTIEGAKTPEKDPLSFSNGFYDDDGTMSEMDTQATGFQRGGRVRASLPISRISINKSKEKPLGLVYLNYMNETKRALMPNEVTGMDTVKALFVRAFPRKLAMPMLDLPQRKIYIRDPVTEIFYELEKLDEVKDRAILKIYEPGFVEDGTLNIHNSTSTPLDLNVYSDSELLDVELPDFRERNYNTVGSKPARASRERVEPHKRPSSTTPMEMGNRRMYTQQERSRSGIPQRSPSAEPFQRGVPERSTAPVRSAPPGPYQRGSPQRMSSKTLPRSQDGRTTPTNTPRSMTMPRQGEKGQVYRPHPENGGRPMEQRLSGEQRIQNTVQTTTMAGPGHETPQRQSEPGRHPSEPGRHPSMERRHDPNYPQHRPDFQPPRSSTPQQQQRGGRTLERGMAGPRGPPPQRTPDPRGGGPPRDGPYRDRPGESPRRQPPPQGVGSPVKAPRGEFRADGQPYPRQPPPGDMTGRSPSRNSGQGMRQPPPIHMQQQQAGSTRSMDRTLDKPRDRSMERPRDRPYENRPMERRDRSQERPRSMPPSHTTPLRGQGPPPGSREMEARVVKQGHGSPIKAGGGPETETSVRISAMEQQIASLAGMVRSALKPGEQPPGSPQHQDNHTRGPVPKHSPERMPPAQAMNRSKNELTGVNEEVIRATQNQRNYASVDSLRDSTDSTSVTPQPMAALNARELRDTTLRLKHSVKDVRDQLKQIRKLQLNMVQDMNVAFRATNRKVQLALEVTPAGNEHPVRSLRTRTQQDYVRYQINRDNLDKDIRDLESSVEEMRDDVVNKHCHVNLAEVDALAQNIGNSSKHIAQQRVAFPVLADKMKAVMQGEMEVVVKEENFIKDEPGKLDDYMKRCKKVTGTLCTLKRLASVQEHRTPVVPVFEQTSEPVNRERLMETIQSISPNHSERVKNLQAADASRQRKQRRTAQELHRFQMDLGKGRQTLKKTQNVDRINQKRRAALRELFKSEEHDAMTPILTPEKMAKQQATVTKKKLPPPPPPKRTHFSQRVVTTHSPTSPSTPGAILSPSPAVVVTSPAESDRAPAIPPKPVLSPSNNSQQVESSSARSTPELSLCMISSVSVNSECRSSPKQVPACAMSPSVSKSEPLLAASKNVKPSMINSQREALTLKEVRGSSVGQAAMPVHGTIMTCQSRPMGSPGGQTGFTSPKSSVTSPRGVVTPEGGVMLSHGAVMIAKSGSATSPGLATTPQRQAPVRLLSSSSQSSPSKTNSPTSPQTKLSSIPVFRKPQNSQPLPQSPQKNTNCIPQKNTIGIPKPAGFRQPSKTQTLPAQFHAQPIKRRSSVPSIYDITPPPKPPRGRIDSPVEPIDVPPKSAFRPFPISGWMETSLDDVPPRKKSGNNIDRQRRHTVTLPQHQKRNGWVPPPVAEKPSPALYQKSQPAPQKSQPAPQTKPVTSPQRILVARTLETTETTVTTVKKGVLNKSSSGLDCQSETEKNTTLHRQNSDPGARPQITIVDKKGALKIQQLKEQYAKLRRLQEEQKKTEDDQTSETNPRESTKTPEPHADSNGKEDASTDSPSKTPTPTEVEVDVSYSQGEASKADDQDEVSSYTKQTVVYRVGPKPYQSNSLERGGNIATREIIADSIPVTNGMVHQPVFSQLKLHEMAPRNFATKAKAGVVTSPQPVNENSTEEKSNLNKNTVHPNGNHNTVANGKNNTTIDHAKTDSPKQVITNGGGKKPVNNGNNKSPGGPEKEVVTTTEKEVVQKLNAVNGKHNGKPELKTVYTKKLEETFIF